MADETKEEFEALVPIEKMPPCPICGEPLLADGDRKMVFTAHGRVAVAHERCHPKKIDL